MNETDDADHVVTAFLRNRGEILLLRRSEAVGTYEGAWGGVSGFAEGDPDGQVRVEIREETGLDPERVTFVRSGRPVRFTDPDLGREWVVHPYLFDCELRAVESSEEHVAWEWVPPTAVVGDEYPTVPNLWTAYERVAPTVHSIAADDEHGAAYLSVRALEVLRDRAGLLVREREGEADPDAEWDELAELARRLLEARPSMAVLRNRVNRAMDEARADVDRPAADDVLEATIEGIERAVDADEAAAETASDVVSGRVLTLSRSWTVLEALRAGDPERVFVAESRPAREGVDVAETLADDVPVTLLTDAATAHVLSRESIDAVLVGADTVLPDGRVVNKTGTRGVAIVARNEGVPVCAIAATDKVSTREAVNLESGERSAVYDGVEPLEVVNPTFDVTPSDCVSGIVTERGVLDPGDVASVASELRGLEAWLDVDRN